ncbi:MAG: lysylphosphatidylglycerol synthase transmembrane domain-containing protein [archaeon]
MNKKIKRLIKLSLGFIILFYFLSQLGFNNVLSTLKETNLMIFFIVVLLYFPVQILASFNYSVLLKSIDKSIPFIGIFKSLTLSQAVGKVFPSQIGEFSIIHFFNSYGLGYGEGLALSIFDKLLTFSLFSLISLYGIYVYFNSTIFLIVLTFILLSFSILFFLIIHEKPRGFIKKYILKDYSKYFKGFSKTFIHILKYKKKYLFLNYFITASKWIVDFFGIVLLFKGFNIDVNLYYVIIVMSITKIISLIPLTFSGLGIKEASATYLFNYISNINNVIGANVLILNRIKMYFLSFLMYLMNLDLLKKDLR